MSEVPLIPWKFVPDWYSLTDEEKAQLMRIYFFQQEKHVPFKFALPGAIGEQAQKAYRQFGELSKDEREQVYLLFVSDFREKGQWRPNSAAAGGTSWLANPEISNPEAVMANCWILEQQGHKALRVGMIKDLFKASGRIVSNPAGFVRSLSAQDPSLITIIAEGPGRAGLTFSLTDEGKAQGAAIQKEYAESADK